MLKNKSLEDINRVANDELFTELTPKEASVIEGGKVFYLTKIEGLPGFDQGQMFNPVEKVCVTLNDNFVWKGEVNFEKPNIPLGGVVFRGSGEIKLYEGDCCTGTLLGSKTYPKDRIGQLTALDPSIIGSDQAIYNVIGNIQ